MARVAAGCLLALCATLAVQILLLAPYPASAGGAATSLGLGAEGRLHMHAILGRRGAQAALGGHGSDRDAPAEA